MPARIKQHPRTVLAAMLSVAAFAAPGAAASVDEQPRILRLAQATPNAGAAQRPAEPPRGPAGGIDGQIADLRRRLNITPPQQPQFEVMAQVMRQNAQELDALAQREQSKGKPNAVDAVQAGARFAEAEAAGMKRLVSPLQALYDSLSEPQKRTVDQVFVGGVGPQPRR